jgi:hypothetical protein
MERPDLPCDHGGGPDLERRLLLGGLTAACLTAMLPPAAAQPALDPAQSAFVDISRFLTQLKHRILLTS